MASKMTSPEETDAALRALRFADAKPDRLFEYDVQHYLRQTRHAVAQIELAMRDGWHSELNGNREQLLAALRPHVLWLDAHPDKDPQIKDARALPTAVLAEVMRERDADGCGMGLRIDRLTPETIAQLVEIGRRLRTQDNRATDAPIFIVEEQRRTYGFDADYADAAHVVWLNGPNDNAEADPGEHARLEAAWDETGEEPRDWTRTAYQDSWEYVTACFTESGCEDYIRRNGHNHRGALRIYAAGSWRNDEFRAVRALLMALAGGAS